jgi:4-hydroxybenzoate polyprenyltransferase
LKLDQAAHPDDAARVNVPIFVDLDGTLVRTDLLYESLLTAVKANPGSLLALPVWLMKGRAHLKRKLAERHQIDISVLPYHEPLCALLRNEAARGRPIILATGSDRLIAQSVADQLGFFSDVLASDGTTNLKGRRKLAAIQAHTDNAPFEYAGNAPEDLPIWAAAQAGILVATPARVTAEVQKYGKVRQHFGTETRTSIALLRALRPQQWTKNLLVFVALLTSFSFGDPIAWLNASLAFIAFCLVASGIYIVNDLLDLASDRAHPTKRRRPFAAGDAPPQLGILSSAVAIPCGLAIGALLPWPTLPWLVVYLMLTLMYSLVLKSLVLVDVIVLAGLYTIRVVLGAAAIEVPTSFWLLVFAIFIFFSLALLKRCAEIKLLSAQARPPGDEEGSSVAKLRGRAYRRADESTLRTLGIASGVASIAMFALYINAPENLTRFATPQILWLICPLLLYWIAIMWIKTDRQEMHDDPVVFALRDRGSLLVVLAICGVFLFAAL